MAKRREPHTYDYEATAVLPVLTTTRRELTMEVKLPVRGWTDEEALALGKRLALKMLRRGASLRHESVALWVCGGCDQCEESRR
jgi:hypothetical protein